MKETIDDLEADGWTPVDPTYEAEIVIYKKGNRRKLVNRRQQVMYEYEIRGEAEPRP